MTIPVVQGVPVEGTAQQQPYQSYENNYQQQQQQQQQPLYNSNGAASAPIEDFGDAKIYTAQELQTYRQNPRKQFQDVFFAVLFWIHIAAVVVMSTIMFSSGNGAEAKYSSEFNDVIFVGGVSAMVSLALSTLSLKAMMNNAKLLVQVALVFSVAMSGVLAAFGLLSGSMIMGVMGLVMFAVGCCYAYAVWHRIPFAAVNLKTALSAVKDNMGLTVVAYIFMALAFGWSVLWFMGLGSTLGNGDQMSLFVVFLLFLSYYWTHEVLRNTMNVTTSGVVGTWWFVPAEASRFWSPALTDSLQRATTTSFGSICFGSLLVAIVQALRALEHYTRENEDLAIVRCIVQCILSCIESIILFLNRWSYVYVGLYGFSYIEAGRNVVNLFQQKGWTAIIADDLASNVLGMISLGIGLASGLVGLLLAWADKSLFEDLGFESGRGPGFLVAFLVGFIFASVYLGVVDSAITTVIVCYAEAPAEFESNHPELSSEMRNAWTEAWPGLV
mmetsp:Transcript_6405/g.18016  ORF Transcript_6405/g.18016 Transcript_6405/m.18016 type:complete len:499 (+) Transcript_6405:67-1563(+)